MSNSIISEGKTTQEAIEKGLKKLGVSKNQAEIKILEEKKKSFFSILDPHVVKVEITVKEEVNTKKEIKEVVEKKVDENQLEKAKQNVDNFLKDFLKSISENIEYKITTENDAINVVISGNDSTILIGYRGEALNAMQVILTNIASKEIEEKVKVILDIANYKDARKKTLEDLAVKLEKTVIKTGKQVTLEPMTSYERKIIHTKLQDSEKVRTYSIGEGDKRRVVIAKK